MSPSVGLKPEKESPFQSEPSSGGFEEESVDVSMRSGRSQLDSAPMPAKPVLPSPFVTDDPLQVYPVESLPPKQEVSSDKEPINRERETAALPVKIEPPYQPPPTPSPVESRTESTLQPIPETPVPPTVRIEERATEIRHESVVERFQERPAEPQTKAIPAIDRPESEKSIPAISNPESGHAQSLKPSSNAARPPVEPPSPSAPQVRQPKLEEALDLFAHKVLEPAEKASDEPPPSPMLQPSSPFRLEMSASQSGESAPQEAPIIEVSIGSIEVKAINTRAPKVALPIREPRKARLSIDDHLNRRLERLP